LAFRRSLALPLTSLALLVVDAHVARSASPTPPSRWTDVTPDARIDAAVARANASPKDEPLQLAAMAVIADLSPRATEGKAGAALDALAASAQQNGLPAEVRSNAALLSRSLAADEGIDAGVTADHALGVVTALSILGPFRDTGGGLDAHDGPEAGGSPFTPSARYSWGTVEVAWREVPHGFAQASGAPLDLFVFPRKESCAWVASHLRFASKQSVNVFAASTGQVRLIFDGADIARDDDVHESLRFDRVASRVDAEAGDHLLAAKVCTGALDDDGQIRLRVTDDTGAWPAGVTESANLGPSPARSEPAGAHGAKKPPLHPLTTALARAIGKPGADVDARLDASILRTLGGADDLRSPRAPGLLAALADGTLDADRLAMAAWIAPSGANRSAWLNRAREQGDDKTRGFVARRLVERHLEAQLPDWARAALAGSKIDQARDGEAGLLSAQVDVALGVDSLRIRAMRRLEAFARAAPKTAPLAVLQWVASLSEALQPSVAAWARDQLAERGERGASRVRVVARTGERADLLVAAKAALAGSVADADEALEVAKAVAGAGAHDEARAMYEQVTAWAPNRAAAWAGLSQELGATVGDATAADALGAALRRARELEPGEARYRAELSLRAQTRASDAESHDDEKYIVPSQVILARRLGTGVAKPTDRADPTSDPGAKAPNRAAAASQGAAVVGDAPDVSERQLHWLRAVVMHSDRRVSEMVQYAREIVIAPRTEEELYEPVMAEGAMTEILRARVHRKDGTEAFAVEEASDDAQPRIRWPELGPGDVVEVAFRSWTAGPVGGRGDPPFYRLDYAGAKTTAPLLYNEDIIESPPDRPIWASVVNGKADRFEDKTEGGRHVVRYVWDAPPNVPDEPLAPPQTEVVPMLVMSTFKDWSDFRAWYGEAVAGFTEPDAQVRELAAKLTRGKASRDDKLRALFDFVADDIRYVNYVSGEWWLPNRPQQLLARREGDCDDKALLLITLLKATGIEAQEVMVQTRLTNQPAIVRAPGAAIPLFDHGIAFLPGPGGGTYLDATSPQSRLGPLPSMDARAVALRMDGPAEIVQLPASTPEDHGIESTWKLQLAPDGDAELEGEEHATGDDAFFMRTYLTEPGARPQWVEDRLVGPWFSTVEVDKKVDFKGDLPRGGADVKWRAHSASLARHEGPELVVPLSPSQPMASQIAPLVQRTLPVWLPPYLAPRKESRTIVIVAPKGFRFEALPQGGDENGGPFGRGHLDMAPDPRDPRTLIVHRTTIFDQSAIPIDQYPAWRAWVQRVDALMHKAVRLEPAAGSPR
jgi:hypothetical protein